jgi:voltage-gated potassium channel Kch
MEQRQPSNWFTRRLEMRVARKGFRPRLAAAVIALIWATGVVLFGVLERLVDPDVFDNVWLGMWWALQTVTTVGYGDVVPGNTAGKIVGSFLMLGGLSLFAVVTGAITSAFVTQAQAHMRARRQDPIGERLDEMSAQLDAIKAELARSRQTGE